MRLLVTLLVPLAAWAAQHIRLPGLDPLKMALLDRGPGFDPSTVSVVALGLGPALSGFVLVELAALAVPRWRHLRSSDRPALRRAAMVTTLALAAVQASFVARFLSANLLEAPGFGARLLVTATLVGGVFFLLGLAWIISRHGLANGFSILLAAPLVPAAIELAKNLARALDLGNLDPPQLVMVLAAIGATIAATRWILRMRDGHAREPTSGTVPIAIAASLLMLPAQLANFGIGEADAIVPGSRGYIVANLLLVIVLGVVFSRLFQPGANFRRTIGFLFGVSLIPVAVTRAKIPIAIDVLAITMATAVVMDLLAESRMRRRHRELVAIAELHRMPDLAAAVAALDEAGIPHHARAACHRALLQFFGPYLPVEILVPADRAEQARSMLSLSR